MNGPWRLKVCEAADDRDDTRAEAVLGGEEGES